MRKYLKEVAKLTSGVYLKPGISNDVLYLQAIHFNGLGVPNPLLKPQVELNDKTKRYLLKENDVLFAAKGTNNFGVVYHESYGKAVASSSFIMIRLNDKSEIESDYLAWFLSNTPTIKEFHQKQLGTTIPSISIEKLKELEVVIPTIEKQKLIVKIQYLQQREKELTQKLLKAKEEKIKRLLINVCNQNRP